MKKTALREQSVSKTAFRRITGIALFAAEIALVLVAAFPPHNLQHSLKHPAGVSQGWLAHSGLSLDIGNVADPLSDSLPAPRRLLPYSVIPGGVQSAEELKSAVRNDSVVASHYADFDLTRAHVVTLDRDRAVYVSYRMGSEVFWTNRRLALHKGETLITDGTHEARTRCGNRISETLLSPFSAQQPPLEALERFPVAGPFEVSNFPIGDSLTPFSSGTAPSNFSLPSGPIASDEISGPASGSPGPGYGSIFTPGPGSPSGPGTPSAQGSPSGPGTPGSGTPGIPTPEPSTLLMLSGALSALWAMRRLRKAE